MLNKDAERSRLDIPKHMRIDAMLNLIRIPLCITDPNQPNNPIVFVNDAFTELTGFSRNEAEGRNCRFLQGPDTTKKSIAEIRDAISTRSTKVVQIVNYRKDGSKFINSLQIGPILDCQGKVALMFGSQLDITEDYNRQKEQERLATAELVHRLKNIVTVMSSVIRISDREIADRNELIKEILQRLTALSNSHFHAIQMQPGQSLDVKSICKLVVEPYAPGRAGALEIKGASAQIGSEYMSPLSLTLHELATNAVKHGALGVEAGRVEITWSQEAEGNVLTMTWAERGGPEVKPSARASGSKMIAGLMRAAGGEITYDWRPEGLVAKVSIPSDG